MKQQIWFYDEISAEVVSVFIDKELLNAIVDNKKIEVKK